MCNILIVIAKVIIYFGFYISKQMEVMLKTNWKKTHNSCMLPQY